MTPFKFSTEIPDIYYECKKRFGVSWEQGIVITYGDTVYSKYPLSPDLEVHETTHVRQQKAMGKELWWKRYFDDKKFRLDQEVEAYRNQIEFIRKNYGRKVRRMAEKKIVKDMEKLYGYMCTKEEAKALVLS